MALKALEVKAFAPADVVYRKTDEKGLYLEVFPNGSKLWRFKYRYHGKEKRLALGAWPEVGLAEARELRDDARRDIRDGRDPSHEKKMAKIASKVSAGNSFHSVAEEFIETKLVSNGKATSTIEKAVDCR